MSEVIISLGANLGDREMYLMRAIKGVESLGQLIDISDIWESEPWGYTRQPSFQNAIALILTTLPPQRLLKELKRMEVELGRVDRFRWGPREIDLDIIDYNKVVLRTRALQLPHPRLHLRAFVLLPLSQVKPDWRHPVTGESLQQLLTRIPTRGIRLYMSDRWRRLLEDKLSRRRVPLLREY